MKKIILLVLIALSGFTSVRAAYRIIYNPATPGSISVDNNTGKAYPYKAGLIWPVFNASGIFDSTLTIRYSPHDLQPILSQVKYSSISLSVDGGSTFYTPATYDTLVSWVNAYLFQCCSSGGGGTTDTIINSNQLPPVKTNLDTIKASQRTIVTNTTGIATSANQTTAITDLGMLITNTTGIATSANQTTANTTLATIATNTSGTLNTSSAQLAPALGAQTTANSTAVNVASDDVITTGGTTHQPQVRPTISTSAYVAGYVVGGVMSFTPAMRTEGGTGTLVSIIIIDFSNQKSPMDVYIFNANPTGGTYTDHAAPTANKTDFASLVQKHSILATDYATVGSFAVASVQIGGEVLGVSTSLGLYAIVVTQGTPTYSTSTDLIFKLGFYND